MRRRIIIAAMAILSAVGMNAQTTIFGGGVISPANMSHMEAAKYSHTENSFLSARVAAMGGAFTSLGADLSSMTINPAGLGMYRSSELGISLSFNSTKSTSSASGLLSNKDRNMNFNQIGVALNLYQGTGALVSFTMGFGYNKLADLNFKDRGRWSDGQVTIGEFFAEQMYGFDPTKLSGSASPFNNPDIYPDEWGGVLAYQTYLIDPAYTAEGIFDNYYTSPIPLESTIDTAVDVLSTGSVGEYSFSTGFNFANIVYLGTTLGIQDIHQYVDIQMAEQYSSLGGENELRAMGYNPSMVSYGTGINFKIGAILRPVSALRIGIAYHTPTLVSLTRDYTTSMTTIADRELLAESLVSRYTYDYSSPSKLLLGASLAISNKAIISVDYDKVWYGGMTLQNRGLEEAFEYDVEQDLGTAENFRVGVEIIPFKQLYVRGGYAFYGSPLNKDASDYADDGGLFYGNYRTHTNNFSLGLGWRFNAGSKLDLVWTTSASHYTDSMLYYYSYLDETTDIEVMGPTTRDMKHTTTTIGLTYSFLF